MLQQVAQKVVQAIVVLWGAATIIFLVVRIIPGNPAQLLLGPTATRAQIATLEHQLGLTQPLVVQYVRYLGNTLRLDFGTSVRLNQPAMEAVIDRLPATLVLALSALVITLLISFPLGVWLATHAKAPASRLVTIGALATQGMPQFWIGIMLIILISGKVAWLPPAGFTGPTSLILPTVALALPYIGWLTRSVADSATTELNEDYVVTARAKGLSKRRILYRHVLPNTAIPTITVIGLLLGTFIASAVIVEQVFAWPGIGRLLLSGITFRDYTVVEAAVLVIAFIYVVLNLAIDVIYMAVDPRARPS